MKKLFTYSNQVTEKEQSAAESFTCKSEDSISQLSDEQNNYIKYNFLEKGEDTTLIACAGSGKTRCMIEKMRYLVLKQLLDKDEIMVFSYSKLTIEHTKICCREYPDKNIFSNDKLIKTIDSFCFDLMKKLNIECAVEILSAKVHHILEEALITDEVDKKEDSIIKKLQKSKYKKIKAIFVDEAEDLNEIQYSIIIYLEKILGCTLHFIGDPNQNIYEFRDSFERYFLHHNAKKFYLSTNFRCSEPIDSFSEAFKFYDFKNISSAQIVKSKNVLEFGERKAEKVEVRIDSEYGNDEFIVSEIKRLIKSGYKANHIAVISPVIGDEFNAGVIRVANLLDKNNVPVINYYNEMREDTTKKQYKGKSKKLGVNLLTIHGSKGLEFGVVFLLKFEDKMLENEEFDASYVASENMNLLYVALTRAKQLLYIIHDENESQLSLNLNNKHICSLITKVPTETYALYGDLTKHVEIIDKKLQKRKQLVEEDEAFTKGGYDDKKDVLLLAKSEVPSYFEVNCNELKYLSSSFKWRTSVTEFIQKIGENEMLKIVEMMTYKKKSEQIFEISDDEQKLLEDLRLNEEALVGCLFEYVFFYQIQQLKFRHFTIHKVIFTLKDTIFTEHGAVKINQQCIISNLDQLKRLKQMLQDFKTENIDSASVADRLRSIYSADLMTDDAFDSMDEDIKNRTAEFLDFGNIGLGQLHTIFDNEEHIFNTISTLNSQVGWEISLPEIVYMVLLRYAIETKHQKYMEHDEKHIDELCQLKPIFENMQKLTEEMSQFDVEYEYEVSNDDMIGFIDFLVLDQDESAIIDMKVENDLSIENILQLILYDMLLEDQVEMESNTRLIIINCLKGVKYEILLEKRMELLEYLGKLLHEDFTKRIFVE